MNNVEKLICDLKSSEDNVRAAAIDATKYLRDPNAVAPLIQALDDLLPSKSRRAVVDVLGRIGDGRAVDPLIRELGNVLFQETAARSLELLGEPIGWIFRKAVHGDPHASLEFERRRDPRILAPLVAFALYLRTTSRIVVRLTTRRQQPTWAVLSRLIETIGGPMGTAFVRVCDGQTDAFHQMFAERRIGYDTAFAWHESALGQLALSSFWILLVLVSIALWLSCLAFSICGKLKVIPYDPGWVLLLVWFVSLAISCGFMTVAQRHMVLLRRLRSSMNALSREIARAIPTQVCPRDFLRVQPETVSLPGMGLHRVVYPKCRRCGRIHDYRQFSQMVVVLDASCPVVESEQGTVLRVNWLLRRRLFDFDSIEIVNATDEDVEHFDAQVRNDSDEFRRGRYGAIPCFVHPQCRLSENTRRILRNTFAHVKTLTTRSAEEPSGTHHDGEKE